MPLTWALLVYIISGAFNALGLTITIIASFIVSAITIVSLSSFKVLDTGLSDGANRILFVLIFGALFYGGTVGATYFTGQPQTQIIGIDGNNITVSLYQNSTVGVVSLQDYPNVNINNIPTYIQYISVVSNPINNVASGYNAPYLTNPNFDSNSTSGVFGYNMGIGEGANNINDSSFQSMPYYNLVNLLFAIMYMLGLYFMVANPSG